MESKKSSTCQPGNISIKYSDILLVETPSLVREASPPLFMLFMAVVGDEVLVMDGGWEISGGTDSGFLREDRDL